MSFSLYRVLPQPHYVFLIENKINLNEFPNIMGVYLLYGHGNKLLYTGQSSNVRKRITQHKYNSHIPQLKNEIDFGNVVKIEIYECETNLDAIILEKYFIQSGIKSGKYNTQYTHQKPEVFFEDRGYKDILERIPFALNNLRSEIKEEEKAQKSYNLLKKNKSIVKKYTRDYQGMLEKENDEVLQMIEEDNRIRTNWIYSIINEVTELPQCTSRILEEKSFEYFAYYRCTEVNISKLCREVGLDCYDFLYYYIDKTFVRNALRERDKIQLISKNKDLLIHMSYFPNNFKEFGSYKNYTKSLISEKESFVKNYINI